MNAILLKIIKPSLALVLLFQFSICLKSRVGDQKSNLEIRLFRAGGLKIKEERFIKQKERGIPCLKFADFFPDKADTLLYFKPTDGRQPKPKDLEKGIPAGWNLHVVYYKGISMIETYQKTGGINEFEKNTILDLQKGNSFWLKKDQSQPSNTPSCFEHDFIREDKKCKAKIIGGSTLMFFSSDFDQALARAREEQLKEEAPESTSGF